jgi:hypothetical protein
MTDLELYNNISGLPADLKKEVEDFVEFLKTKNKKEKTVTERKFGCAKGLIEMSPDFEEPLDDFKDYM